MKRIQDIWQRDLDDIEHRIDQLCKDYELNAHATRRTVIRKKIYLNQAQWELASQFEQMRKIARQKKTTPRRASLVIWGQRISITIEKYFKNFSALASQRMWLGLIKAQLTGSFTLSPLDDDEVIALSSRLADLQKTEKLLSYQYASLDLKKKFLREKYQHLITSQSNANAAMSFYANMKKNGDKLSAVGDYLKWLTLPVRNTTDLDKRRNARQKTLSKESRSLLSYCREMLRPSGEVNVVLGDETIRKIGNNLNKIAEIKEEIRVLNEKIINEFPLEANPIVLKKSSLGYKSESYR